MFILDPMSVADFSLILAMDHYQPRSAQTGVVVLVCYQTTRHSTLAANHQTTVGKRCVGKCVCVC